MTSPDDVEKTKLCNNLPAGCVNIEMPSVVGKALFPVETVQGIIEVNSSFKSVMENQYPEMKRGATTSDESTTSLSDLTGGTVVMSVFPWLNPSLRPLHVSKTYLALC